MAKYQVCHRWRKITPFLGHLYARMNIFRVTKSSMLFRLALRLGFPFGCMSLPMYSVQRWYRIAGNASTTSMIFWCWLSTGLFFEHLYVVYRFMVTSLLSSPKIRHFFFSPKKWKPDVDTEKTTSFEDQIWPSSFVSHSSASSVSLDNQNSALYHCLRTEILVQAGNKPFFSRFSTEKKGEQKIRKPESKSKRTGIFFGESTKKKWLFATSDTPTGLACKRILGSIIFLSLFVHGRLIQDWIVALLRTYQPAKLTSVFRELAWTIVNRTRQILGVCVATEI